MRQGRLSSNRRVATGFSLIELMVVVALVGIVTAIAVPSFRSMIETNRVAAEVNSFTGDLQFARSEAIKRGLPVSICVSSNGTSCVNANTWQTGWIVFSDIDGSGTLGTGDSLLRKRPAWTGGDTFVAVPATTTTITYNRDGFAQVPVGSGNALVLTLLTKSQNAAATRCVSLNRVGRYAVQTGGTGTCK